MNPVTVDPSTYPGPYPAWHSVNGWAHNLILGLLAGHGVYLVAASSDPLSSWTVWLLATGAFIVFAWAYMFRVGGGLRPSRMWTTYLLQSARIVLLPSAAIGFFHLLTIPPLWVAAAALIVLLLLSGTARWISTLIVEGRS